jgi:hypothetical protein
MEQPVSPGIRDCGVSQRAQDSKSLFLLDMNDGTLMINIFFLVQTLLYYQILEY